jgi:tRNA pseudouridine55 synthase
MDGALLVDKPAGLSSAQVIRQLKKSCGISKIGHSGTLDPMATGVLVILCGRATRLQFLFLESSKSYRGAIRLGIKTNTDDITGDELVRDQAFDFRSKYTLEQAAEYLKNKFSGELLQVPPAVSAIKVNGVRSYRRVRRGEEVILEPRSIVVDVRKLNFSADDVLDYEIHCSKGTYIRSIARDMGEALGTVACLQSIERIYSDPFSIEDAHKLDDINPENVRSKLIDMEQLVAGIPAISLSVESCDRLARGDQSELSELEDLDKIRDFHVVALFNSEHQLKGLIDFTNGSWGIRMMMP